MLHGPWAVMGQTGFVDTALKSLIANWSGSLKIPSSTSCHDLGQDGSQPKNKNRSGGNPFKYGLQ